MVATSGGIQKNLTDLTCGVKLKIYLANSSEQKFGGGFSFISNFRKALPITDNYDEADVYFVPGASMIKPELASQARKDGKKVVLRVDNFLKHSRNRGKGMSRMKSIAHVSDLIIYQSSWARDFLSPYLNKTGPVILNGVDLDVFTDKREPKDKTIYMYSRFNRDNSKNWEEAQYFFMREWQKNQDIELWIVGQFGQEMREWNFDFFNDEAYKFFGVQKPENLASLYRQTDYFLYTYFMDACSNTLIEALVSGCKVPSFCDFYLRTGGASEIMYAFKNNGRDYFSLDRLGKEYRQVLSG